MVLCDKYGKKDLQCMASDKCVSWCIHKVDGACKYPFDRSGKERPNIRVDLLGGDQMYVDCFGCGKTRCSLDMEKIDGYYFCTQRCFKVHKREYGW